MHHRNNKSVGILKLNTHFPRLNGDIGNPETFNYPVIYQTITSATPATVITGKPIAPAIATELVDNALVLQQKGVSLITTSCGFLSPLQHTLSSSLNIPVITSSLLLLPLLTHCFGQSHVGVITFDAARLNHEHLQNQAPVAIEGLRVHDSLRCTIESDLESLDRQQAEAEVRDALIRLLQQQPNLRAVLLECTNLSPYKQVLRSEFGLSVFDLVDAVHWMLDSQ